MPRVHLEVLWGPWGLGIQTQVLAPFITVSSSGALWTHPCPHVTLYDPMQPYSNPMWFHITSCDLMHPMWSHMTSCHPYETIWLHISMRRYAWVVFLTLPPQKCEFTPPYFAHIFSLIYLCWENASSWTSAMLHSTTVSTAPCPMIDFQLLNHWKMTRDELRPVVADSVAWCDLCSHCLPLSSSFTHM